LLNAPLILTMVGVLNKPFVQTEPDKHGTETNVAADTIMQEA